MSERRGIPVEVLLALGALIVLAPLLAVIALFALLGSGAPAVFRQQRVGRDGRPLTILNCRTLVASSGGPAVTTKDDGRITRVGRTLRRTRLDELPELWNVFRGDMSLVGRRAEAPKYVLANEPRWKSALKPGSSLTAPVTLSPIGEETLLASVEGDRDACYLTVLLPQKGDGYRGYLKERTWRTDAGVLLQIVKALMGWVNRR